MNNSLETELKKLYDSEINVTISSIWDGGWRVSLGNERRPNWDFCEIEEIVPALRALAKEHYPNSTYVKNLL